MYDCKVLPFRRYLNLSTSLALSWSAPVLLRATFTCDRRFIDELDIVTRSIAKAFQTRTSHPFPSPLQFSPSCSCRRCHSIRFVFVFDSIRCAAMRADATTKFFFCPTNVVRFNAILSDSVRFWANQCLTKPQGEVQNAAREIAKRKCKKWEKKEKFFIMLTLRKCTQWLPSRPGMTIVPKPELWFRRRYVSNARMNAWMNDWTNDA